MKVLAVLLALAGTCLYVQAQNVVCGKGTSSKTVTLEDGESYSFKTHKGKKYKGNTECTVDYKMGDTCAEMSFACTKFNTNNKDKKKCKKGDMVTITANGKAKAYCKTKKPKVTSSGDMQVVFSSDAKKHSSGAVCKVTCTEAASTTATTTEAAGGGGAGTTAAPAPPGTTAAPAPPGTTAAPAPPGTTAAPGSDDTYVTQAKALIDAGTCDSVSASSVCGDDVTGYYKEFEYNGMRVVVASGAPDHAAEHDQLVSNPNTRCERWQFMQVPLNPAKGSGAATSLGTIGLAVTGGGYFNHLSSPTGSLALANEGPSLDSCLGHSAGGGTYHYHANINCTDAGAATGANDADICLKIGYYRDGVPVYGLCKDSSGVQMTSCYSLVSGSTTSNVVTISGTYNVASTNTDYEYNPTSDCNLDEGNGAIHPTTGEYSYFMTTDYPWVPIYYYGEEGSSRLCALNL